MEVSNKSDGQETIQGSVFGLLLVEYLAEQSQPRSMTDITKALSLSRSRVHRHLQALVATGYLHQCPETDRYRIGSRSLSLGALLEHGDQLVEVSLPIMRDLRDSLGHTVILSALEPKGMRVVASIVGTSPFEIGVRRGTMLNQYATAQGRISLAFASPENQDLALATPFEPLTPETVVEPVELKKILDRIKKQGWSIAPNQSLLGLNALAAPIRDAHKQLVASIAIVDSIQRLQQKPEKEQVDAVIDAADSISRRLGIT